MVTISLVEIFTILLTTNERPGLPPDTKLIGLERRLKLQAAKKLANVKKKYLGKYSLTIFIYHHQLRMIHKQQRKPSHLFF